MLYKWNQLGNHQSKPGYIKTVEDSAKLAKLTATPKKDRKMSYAETARVKKAVHWQNETISAGKHPTG